MPDQKASSSSSSHPVIQPSGSKSSMFVGPGSKPEDLDRLALHLSKMGAEERHAKTMVLEEEDEEDDDDEEEDDDEGNRDGTLPASEPARPLRNQTGESNSRSQWPAHREDNSKPSGNFNRDTLETLSSMVIHEEVPQRTPQLDLAMTRLAEDDGEGTLVARRNKSEPVIQTEPERDRRSAAASGPVDRRAGGDHVSRDKERGHHGHGQQAKLPSSGSGIIPQHVHRTSSNSSTSSAPGAVGSSHSPRHSGVMPDLVPPHTPPQSRSPPTPQRPQDKMSSEEYRRAVLQPAMKHQRSFSAFGFGAAVNDQGQAGSTIGSVSSGSSGTVQGRHSSAASGNSRRGSQINVNVAPLQTTEGVSDTPEIRKYKKRFGSDILCAALWGVNLLIGTESGLMLLDRSGQGKVYTLISRRRFQQMEVLEGQNILVTISGKKSKIRVYYLSFLKSKILKNDTSDKKNGWVNVGELEGCVHFKIVKYERIKFLVIALHDSVEIYAWAPKPYHKFMAFKSFPELKHKPQLVDLTVEEGQRLKVIYGSSMGFHAIDLDSSSVFDLYIPSHNHGPITPHTIVILPNTNGLQLLLCYDNEGVYVDTTGKITKNVVLQWGELPTSVAYISTGQIMGWGNKAIEIRSAETGHLDGVFMHKKAQKLKFLCERNDKVFFSSVRSGSSCQIYFMTLSKPGLANW